MAIIMSILALCVALVALWMGSASMRKSDGDFSSFILNARKELSAVKVEIDQTVTNISKRVDTLDQLVASVKAEAGKSSTAVSSLQTELRALRNDLDTLDESIPKQYRHPTPRRGHSQVAQ